MVANAPVVYVDDDPLALQLFEICWERCALEHPLLTFGEPEHLLAHMAEVAAERSPEPHVLVVDVRMNRMDGFTLVEQLKASSAQVPPILFFTSSQHPDDQARASTLGASLARKPATLDDFQAFLRGLVA